MLGDCGLLGMGEGERGSGLSRYQRGHIIGYNEFICNEK